MDHLKIERFQSTPLIERKPLLKFVSWLQLISLVQSSISCLENEFDIETVIDENRPWNEIMMSCFNFVVVPISRNVR